jgi:bacteriocin-like protein
MKTLITKLTEEELNHIVGGKQLIQSTRLDPKSCFLKKLLAQYTSFLKQPKTA